jgi:intracellular septation protein A
MTGLTIVFVIAQSIYLMRHIDTGKKDVGNSEGK